ncbi:MAG: signal recognition particle-docking protein FtsY [Actinomycetota bacterium]|nr:signal recognition particle-docking protein FtsY [Actinomycetota bacterium]
MSKNQKQNWWGRLSDSLTKSRNSFSYQVKSIFSGESLTDDDWETLEEVLIGADVGVDTTSVIVDHLRQKVVAAKVYAPDELMELLRAELTEQLEGVGGGVDLDSLKPPAILLFVGVNGTGKTTTIGKVAGSLKRRSGRITLAAADTFRAAAIEQLQKWAERAGAEFIKHQRGADPAAVVYDAVESMRAGGKDFLLVDTAGRLQTYVNLMEELKKIKRVALRGAGDIPVKTLLVMDATTGQNGISQARLFDEALNLDGIILTKLDGTAKGGIALAIQRQLGIPIVAVGTGEQVDDVAPFSAAEFVEALLG